MEIARKINHFVVLIFLAVVLSACTPSGQQTTQTHMSGTEGITLSFVGNSPPPIIYVDDRGDDRVSIDIEARNRGTSPSNVEVFFSGFDERIVDVQSISGFDFSSEVDYRTRFNPVGGYREVSTTLNVRDLGTSSAYEFPLRVIYCYDYETVAAVQLCVDPNPHRRNTADACTPSSVNTNGQGAPVGISSVEQESMPGRVRLKINVQHYGQGQVLTQNAECRGIPARSEEDYIAFSPPTLGGIPGDCPTQNPVKLQNGRANIICNFDLPDADAPSYMTLLEMRLEDYKIKDSIQRNIRIINERTRR
ncbi:MAG: hypothetical protein ACMXYE_00240 [Candidatus Woesearchaeota archaeon]